MAVQKKFALGRGLDVLISTEEVKTAGSSSINEIELSKISVNPNQPRREFDPVALQELADSIAEIGIIQPITLRQLSEDSYQIITVPPYRQDLNLFRHTSAQPMTRM